MKKIFYLSVSMLLFAACEKPQYGCFDYYPKNIMAGDTVTFDASCSQNAYWYKWNFGDGSADTNATNPLITHMFAAKGTYVVKLVAMRKDGVSWREGTPEKIVSIEVK